ncbi:MAG: glycosyltransferase family 2 protein [Bacteroidales bacterium]|nr:glycosyltransferase family 2 protein [Bacteroidales bacterium]
MTNPEISIIVPVYNVEKYLCQCLDSIKAQTFRNWECILVDDGSTDSSASICDSYSQADSRFIVIHKENGGVSSARNAALEIARGEFIGFTDPDDWCEPEMFGHLLHLIKTHDADIAQVGFMLEFAGIEPDKPAETEVSVIDRKTAMMEIGTSRLRDYVWNKLHRRKVISCGFPTGRNFEDIYMYMAAGFTMWSGWCSTPHLSIITGCAREASCMPTLPKTSATTSGRMASA